jgi:hypothetical protein
LMQLAAAPQRSTPHLASRDINPNLPGLLSARILSRPP